MTDNFAQALKRARAATGLSQRSMAERMLIPRRTVEDWERGISEPPAYVQRFVLNELESLNGSAPRATWVDFSDKHDRGMDLRCSQCNKRASSFVGGTEDWWDLWAPDYCPHCGAKMSNEKEEG